MSNIINITELDSRLSVKDPYLPIICGNSTYTLHFEFTSPQWLGCEYKVAVFEFKGLCKKILFNGTDCDVPELPNTNCVFLSLLSSEDYGEHLVTPRLELSAKPSVAGTDAVNDDYFQDFLVEVVSLRNAIANGNLFVDSSKHSTDSDHSKTSDHATEADHSAAADNAKNSEEAKHSTNSDKALLADEATHAGNADNATQATKATHAETADSATSATNATHAESANTATKAEEATHADMANTATSAASAENATHAETADSANTATHANSADSATVANSSKTQVDLTTNQTIDGVKDFTGELKYQGQHVLTASAVINPNFLVNGDFRVNQRNKTSYSVSQKYTVDRWMSKNTNATITPLSESGIQISINSNLSASSPWSLNQAFEDEDKKILLGKTVTISIKLRSNTITGGVAVSLSSANNAHLTTNLIKTPTYKVGDGVISQVINIPASLPGNYLIFAIQPSDTAKSGESCVVEWAKLEIGNVATEYLPKSFAEELATCQRFYISNIDESQFWMDVPAVMCSGEADIYPQVDLPVQMRTSPTLASWNTGNVRGQGKSFPINEVTIHGYNNFGVRLHVNTQPGMTLGYPYAWHEGRIELDAEIY